VPHQVAITIGAPIRPGQVAALTELLQQIDAGDRRAKLLPFESLPVHFARFVVLDSTVDLAGSPIGPSLIFLSDVDSPARAYLRDLADQAGEGLDQIFAHCEDYPASPSQRGRVAYLRAKTIRTDTAYVNTVGRSVQQVHDEARLRNAIEDFLDAGRWSGQGPENVRNAVKEFVAGDPALSWALKPAAPPSRLWRLKETAHMIGAAAIVVALLPAIVIGLPFWLIALRIHEARDQPSTAVPDRAFLDKLEEVEDLLVQNQISAVGFVKPGKFRLLTFRAVLWILSYASRHLYVKGNLAGITTIHFARWVFLDDRRRLIFASNYDGSIESYMDDFIDKVAFGLNAAFSNGVGYPRTKWLITGGAKDEQAFKNYLRTHQIPTQIWYSAYGDLSARNIADNAAIRAGLSATLSDVETAAWARRL
jgi:hypothetical protein